MRRAILLAAAASALAGPAAGQDAGGAGACETVSPPETIEVAGVARDSASGVALPGTRVTFTWDRGADQVVGKATAVADSRGWYRICPVPTGVPVTLSSTFPRRRAEGVVTFPAERELVRLDFVLTGVDAPAEDRPSRVTLLETGASGAGETGTLTGSVRDQASGAPLVGAQVSVPDLEIGTVTEPEGRFRIDGIPAGDHVLRVEHLGYRTAEESFVAVGSDYAVVAWLAPRAIAMDALEVRARSRDQYEDRASGSGRYRVDRSDFENRPAATISEILRSKVPGVRTGRDPRGCPMIMTRRGSALIVVDGVPFRDGCILNEIPPEVVETVEVLSTTAASIRWGSLGGNGVVEITTRRK